MAAKKPFTVIIAGGGIAGLTLAHMFEKFGIDYVLLEAYKNLAPAVGASIGLLPHGLLILDQIGCYEAIKEVADSDNDSVVYTRKPNGKVFAAQESMYQHMEKRHGYPILFFDRQWLLKVLYERLRNKNKVFVNQKVQTISTGPSGVEVKTASGDVFSGSIIIGADGVHSTVRREMRRLADERSPGYFSPGEEDNVPSYYHCSFGIAQDVLKWKQGDQTFTCGHGKSMLVSSGPRGRCYWFLFIKFANIRRGKDIPKFTRQDEEKMVEENRDFLIQDNLTFGDVYDKRISSTLTSLHEIVYKKWFYERMILIGDSAHKPNPLTGMGGNGAIESAAELVNKLLDVRNERPGGLDDMSTAEIYAIFHKAQQARYERANIAVNASHQQQALLAYERPFVSHIFLQFAALLGSKEAAFANQGSQVVGGTRLTHTPVPRRPRAIPFDFELPAAPFRTKTHSIVRIVFILAMAGFLLFTTKIFALALPWAGVLPVGGGPLASFKAQAAFITVQLVSPLLVWVIEGYRTGNEGGLLALPTLFSAAVPVFGISRVIPLYAIALALSPMLNPVSREAQPLAVKSILPALILAYIVPTIAMVIQLGDSDQKPTTLWRFAPALFTSATAIIWKAVTLLVDSHQGAIRLPEDGKVDIRFDSYKDLELPFLNVIYPAAFLALSSTNIWALFSTYPQSALLATSTDYLAPFDLLAAFPAIVALQIYTVYEMRRLGQITTLTALCAAILVLLAQFLVGPGASWIALWFWRENVVARLSTFNKKM
ncbi:FAD dependent monooxygenase [Microdochium nivale]|nr:FAD dependent monooxygenase [Microdochium nivale]